MNMCLYCGYRYQHGIDEVPADGGGPLFEPPGYLNKVSYDWDQAAAQISRANNTWASSFGQAATVTFGWRNTKAGYNVDDSDVDQDPTSVNGMQVSGFQQIGQPEKMMALRAFALWSDVARITFSGVNLGGYTDNATILVGGSASSYSAFAWLPEGVGTNTAATAYQGDVWISRGNAANLDSTIGSGIGSRRILHEIGHAIGLDHPGNYNNSAAYDADAVFLQDTRNYTAMSYFEGNEWDSIFDGFSAAPMLYDIAALQRIYGANMTTRTGDTTYGVNSNVFQSGGQNYSATINEVYNLTNANQFLSFAIWDAGGYDTLDLSLFTESTRVTASYDFASNTPVTRTVTVMNGILIDMRPEHFSSAGINGSNNIAIARGVTIERAISGAGNDTVYGNEAANTIW
jgi:serralysin